MLPELLYIFCALVGGSIAVRGMLVPFLWPKLVRAMERFTGFGEDLGAWTSETRANG
jgi:hypothetical protein